MIVLDTNVVAELMRAAPSPTVADWVRAHKGHGLRTTSITLAEIRYGIERLPKGRRKERLRSTADDVFGAFPGQVLPFDADAASAYAVIVSVRDRDRAGRPISGFDAQIAAICRTRRAPLATRNSRDFQQTGIDLLDPWQ